MSEKIIKRHRLSIARLLLAIFLVGGFGVFAVTAVSRAVIDI